MRSPEILPDDIATPRALVLAAWAGRDAERGEKARLVATDCVILFASCRGGDHAAVLLKGYSGVLQTDG